MGSNGNLWEFMVVFMGSNGNLWEFKIHHFEWVNPLFLWPFSIAMSAMLNYQRIYLRETWRGPGKTPKLAMGKNIELAMGD